MQYNTLQKKSMKLLFQTWGIAARNSTDKPYQAAREIDLKNNKGGCLNVIGGLVSHENYLNNQLILML